MGRDGTGRDGMGRDRREGRGQNGETVTALASYAESYVPNGLKRFRMSSVVISGGNVIRNTCSRDTGAVRGCDGVRVWEGPVRG